MYHHRCVGEWHRGAMSSSELLDLLEELPESSKFKEASERAYRLVKYHGDDPELREKYQDEPQLMRAIGSPPADFEVLTEFIDWTYDRKIAARTVRELIAARGQTDFSNLEEPYAEAMADIRAKAQAEKTARARNYLLGGAFGLRKVVSDAGLP